MKERIYIIMMITQIICLLLLTGGAFHKYIKTEIKTEAPETRQIVNKYEADGKCYIQTWIEITPEEYIGYDIGDEYKEKQ